MADQITPPAPIDDEIDLLALAKTIWVGRKTILKAILAFGLIGLLVALFSPKEYVAKTIIVPTGNDASKAGGLGGLGGLAAMAGINLNVSAGSELSPLVYPQIVTSIPFELELMNTSVRFKELKEPVTLFDYYTKIQKPNLILKYTLGLPGVLLQAIKGKPTDTELSGEGKVPITLTEKQKEVLLQMDKLITLEANAKEGYLTLTATMPEPLAAAQLGQRAQELLQQFITEFKIKKAKANLDFIQQRVDETTKKMEAAQEKLASFSDRNKNVAQAVANIERDKLNREFNLVYSIYSDLAKQLEQAKIQVKQDTPVFTIVEPISVPTKKSKPNRPMILMIWIFLGGVVGTGWVFGKGYWQTVKEEWRKKEELQEGEKMRG